MPRRKKPARLYNRKDDGMWIILDSGRQIRTGCRTDEREEAETHLQEYLKLKAEGLKQPTDPSKITIARILRRYAEDVGPTQKAPERTAYAIEALLPFWGNLKPSEISIANTLAYSEFRQRAPGTIRRELGVLRTALNYAALDIHLPNPPKIMLPKKPRPRNRWLTKDEISLLLKVAPPHLERFILISVLTGRRKRAVLDLEWKPSPSNGWIDLQAGKIHFLGTDEEESGKQRGSITMPEFLWQKAKLWSEDEMPSVIHYEGKKIADIDSSFDRACRVTGIDGAVRHTLKHTAVTWAFQKGMTLEDAVEYFATSAETLMETYRHHSPHHQSRAASVMNQIGADFIANNVAGLPRIQPPNC